jgi:hypothetical protein
VKTPTVEVKEYRILTPEEYARLYLELPNDAARLLIELAIGSGFAGVSSSSGARGTCICPAGS